MTYLFKKHIPIYHSSYSYLIFIKCISEKRNINYISFLDISSHPLWRYDYNGFFKTKSLVDGIVNDIQDNLLFYKKMGIFIVIYLICIVLSLYVLRQVNLSTSG